METIENARPLSTEDYWARMQALREQLAATRRRGRGRRSSVPPGDPRPVTRL
jgi:hypothetical protein